MKKYELLTACCEKYPIERGDFVKEIAEMTTNEFGEFTKEIKRLIHFRDTTVGLYAMDSDPCDLLHKFWQRKSDACPLECTEAEKMQDDFNDFVLELRFQIEY